MMEALELLCDGGHMCYCIIVAFMLLQTWLWHKRKKGDGGVDCYVAMEVVWRTKKTLLHCYYCC